MNAFTPQELNRWLGLTASPCVTIYFPTTRGTGAQAGAIRLKNMLSQAETRLLAQGFSDVECVKLLKPGYKLAEDDRAWKDLGDGMAVLITNDGIEAWTLPFAVPETAAVGEHPCLKPALPLLTDNQPFHVLAVTQKGVRFYHGDRWHLTPAVHAKLSGSMLESLNNQQPQGLMQVHGAPGQNRGDEGTFFHGQSGEVDRHKDELLSWFRVIDREVHAALHNDRAPLVFAGVQYLFPIYQKVNSYSHLFSQPVHGNPDQWNDTELHRRVTELLAPAWQQAMRTEREHFAQHLGSHLVSASIEDVLVAAREGRVKTAFVDRDKELRGKFSAAQGTVELLSETALEGEDLLDRVAREVLTHRGQVFAVAADEIPAGIGVAALYRYERQAVG